MIGEWAGLEQELRRWGEAGRPVTLWWRDDDAVDASAPLDRLLALGARYAVPLALAVIPGGLRRGLVGCLRDLPVSVLQHGVTHANRAPPGERRSEFPVGIELDRAVGELLDARQRLVDAFAARIEPLLVPPWNRIDRRLATRVTPSPYMAISGYGTRTADDVVPFVNTHVDVIDWRGTRGFVGRQHALDGLAAHLASRRTGRASADETTGLLTHHLVHDAATWSFLHELCEWVESTPLVRWRSVPEVLADARGELGCDSLGAVHSGSAGACE